MTEEGKLKLEQELEYLKTVKRKEVVETYQNRLTVLEIYRRTLSTILRKTSRLS